MSDESEQPHSPALPDNVVSELAELAGTPDGSRKHLSELLAQIVEEAGFSDVTKRQKLRLVTAADVEPPLRKALEAIERADEAFARLQGDGVDAHHLGAVVWAGCLFESALGVADATEIASNAGFLSQVTTDRRWLAARRGALTRAIEQVKTAFPPPPKPGRPRGTPNFDRLIMRMDQIAEQTGGKWTLTRDPYADENENKWKGTMLRALKILRPYLPPVGFFPDPDTDLGFAVERARKSENQG